MSIQHRLEHFTDKYGTSPRLYITVEGIDDVYRLARVLERAQVEFCEVGGKTLRGLDRRYPGIVQKLVARMGPTSGYQGVTPKLQRCPHTPRHTDPWHCDAYTTQDSA